MQTKMIYNHSTQFRSDKCPDVCTNDRELARVIQWADANPHVWKIVTGTKSKAFGRNSCVYIGWAQRKMDSDSILERVRHFHDLVHGIEPHLSPTNIFTWRAQFTFEHFRDRGFTGGFFQQHDGKHPRLCLTLDYTQDTLEEVIDHFYKWCRHDYKTEYITVDKKVVRHLGGS